MGAVSSEPTSFVQVDGRRVRFTASGEGDPILMIHGIGRSLEDWSAVRDDLATTHRVYSIDLPGYGESDRLTPSTTLTGLARAALDFAQAVGETRPLTLVGNSLGGAVSLKAAELQPDRVAALVLVDSAGFGKEVTVALRAIAVPGLGRWLLRPNRDTSARTLRGIFYDKSHVTKERIELDYRLAHRPGAADVMLETARDLGTIRGVRADWRQALLTAVVAHGIPTLITWGDKDLILPAHHLEAAVAAFPHARSHIFPDTGHMPQLERPDEFVTLVEDFLAEIR